MKTQVVAILSFFVFSNVALAGGVVVGGGGAARSLDINVGQISGVRGGIGGGAVGDISRYNNSFNVIGNPSLQMPMPKPNINESSKRQIDDFVNKLRAADGVTIVNPPSVASKVLFIQKQHSELVYDVAVPGEKEVIRLNQRPEEFTGLEGQRVFDALKKSSATKQWVDVQQVMDLYKMNSQQGN